MLRSVAPAIQYLGTVTSTMDVAKEMIADAAASPASDTAASAPKRGDADAPFGVVAEVQTKGRGTAGKSWESPSGNLMFSMAVPQAHIPPSILPVLPLVVGIAVRDAACKAAQLPTGSGVSQIRTKWPNDSVWMGRKLSGVLIEPADAFVIIGIGLNVKTAPEVADGGRATVSLKEIMSLGGSARLVGPTVPEMAESIWQDFFALLEAAASGALTRSVVVERFSKCMDWDLTLLKRDASRKQVKAVRLNEWGHLTVKAAAEASSAQADAPVDEEILISEYLF